MFHTGVYVVCTNWRTVCQVQSVSFKVISAELSWGLLHQHWNQKLLLHLCFLSITKYLLILHRTLMDLLIALSHIVAGPSHLAEATTHAHFIGCATLGCINQVALLASNFWFVVLALDLLKAIRNPFRWVHTHTHPVKDTLFSILVYKLTYYSVRGQEQQ